MRYIQLQDGGTARVGLALGPSTAGFVGRCPDVADYAEAAFEQLRHDPDAAALQHEIPFILHCASMSVAGFVPPDETTLQAIEHWTKRTGTPWIGEHLAFVLADAISDPSSRELGLAPTDGPPRTLLTFTVCPQLSEQTLERAVANLAALQERFDVPILLENPPQYFDTPGSTLSQLEFISELARRSEVGFLLDVTHLLITATNCGFDPHEGLDRFPLERVVEIHLSGVKIQSGVAWDDHAGRIPARGYELLAHALERARPKAVTLEYNAGSDFPDSAVAEDVLRVRDLLAAR